MTIVDKPTESSDPESGQSKPSGCLTPSSSGDMDSSSASWGTVSSALDAPKSKASSVGPTPGAAVYSRSTAPVQEKPKPTIHKDQSHEAGFCMMCTMQNHITQVFANSGNVIKPMSVINDLKRIAKHFRFGCQEDAHEFLRYTIDAMQKSCLPGNRLDRQTQATTLIHQIFGGYLRSRVKCLNCKAVSDTFDPYLDVALEIKTVQSITKALEQFVKPEQLDGENAYKCTKCKKMVPASKRFTIHRGSNVLTISLKCFANYNGGKITKTVQSITKALEQFVKPEQLDGENAYKCTKCKKMVPASKRFTIHRGSNVLTISLKCFANYNGGKITKDVRYPEFLDIRPFMSQSTGEPVIYVLYAVLVHSGFSCHAGHYYCYIKASNGQWYQMNDSIVSTSDIRSVLNQQAYVLFYISSNHINGNGSMKEIPCSSKASGSNIGLKRMGSSQPSTSFQNRPLNRPTVIPEPAKRPKLTFQIGQSKSARPSHSQPNFHSSPLDKLYKPSTSTSTVTHSSSSSFSTAQSTSGAPSSMAPATVSQADTPPEPPCSRVNGAPKRSASFLVPYAEESSEESDEEPGPVKENGYAKSLNGTVNGTRLGTFPTSSAIPPPPDLGKNHSGVPHCKAELNGLTTMAVESEGTRLTVETVSYPLKHTKPIANGLLKTNGFKHSDKLTSDMPDTLESIGVSITNTPGPAKKPKLTSHFEQRSKEDLDRRFPQSSRDYEKSSSHYNRDWLYKEEPFSKPQWMDGTTSKENGCKEFGKQTHDYSKGRLDSDHLQPSSYSHVKDKREHPKHESRRHYNDHDTEDSNSERKRRRHPRDESSEERRARKHKKSKKKKKSKHKYRDRDHRSHQDSSEANSDSDSRKHKKKKKHRSDGSDQEKPQRSQYRKQNSKSGDESDSSNKASKSNNFRGIDGRTYSQKQYSEEKEELSHKENNSQTESGHYTSSEQHRGYRSSQSGAEMYRYPLNKVHMEAKAKSENGADCQSSLRLVIETGE
ncbi:UNVERIFIED_CONTAM: hypothetical protein FKN15_034472 [Acipenser sinensis]